MAIKLEYALEAEQTLISTEIFNMLNQFKRAYHRIAIMPKPRFCSNIIRCLVKVLVPQRFQVDGISYVLNPQDYIIKGTLFLGIYEKAERKIFSTLVRSGDLVIDIGANIGIFTGIAAQKSGVAGKVLAFEPEPYNAGYLLEMLSINRFENVTLETIGVADRESTFHLYLSRDNMGDHRLEPGEEARESIEIQAAPLDLYLKGSLPKVIKMDIQGSEGLAMRGMSQTLRNMPEGAVMMEFWPYAIRRSGVDPAEVLEGFASAGFTGYEIDAYETVLKPIELQALLSLTTQDESVNILFLKGENYRSEILRLLG